MKLFYMRGGSSLASHIVLEWTCQTYKSVRMDRLAIKTPQYLALNPNGLVPLLVHGDFALTENVAILGYLSDLHPHLQLAGDGSPRSRAEVMRWLGYLNSDVHKAFRPIFFPGRYLPGHEVAAQLAAVARSHVRDHLQRLDAQLEGQEWLTGSRSIADAYLFVMVRWAIGTKISLQEFDNLAAFVRRMHADEGVHAALVMEEGLAPATERARGAPDQLMRLNDRIREDLATTLQAEVVGTVEYGEGDGAVLEVRRGLVEIEISRLDTVFSWQDENFSAQAAIPYQNFSRYVSAGAIRLAL